MLLMLTSESAKQRLLHPLPKQPGDLESNDTNCMPEAVDPPGLIDRVIPLPEAAAKPARGNCLSRDMAPSGQMFDLPGAPVPQVEEKILCARVLHLPQIPITARLFLDSLEHPVLPSRWCPLKC